MCSLSSIAVDYEDFNAFQQDGNNAQNWLINFTKALRAKLPSGQYTISHAPIAPWFSNNYANGGYLNVNKQVGSLIDWYVVSSSLMSAKRTQS